MTQWLRYLTAGTIPLGPFVDDTDGKTAETGLTIAQADVRLSKMGAAFAQVSGTANLTHMENGYYALALGTADTDTLGRLRVAVLKTGALAVWQDFSVVPQNAYDALMAGSDTLDVMVADYATGKVPLQPTTAGRTLDVTADGAAGIDWGNVENATASVELNATTIAAANDVLNGVAVAANGLADASLAADIGTRLRTELFSGPDIHMQITALGEVYAFEVTGNVDGKILGMEIGGPVSFTGPGVQAELAANQDVRNVAGTIADKTGYALTSAYDAAKTAASQASVDVLPGTAALNTALSAVHGAGSWEGGGAAPTAGQVATAVWGDNTRYGPGSKGENVDAAGSRDPAPTVEEIDTALSATHGAGSWGTTGGSGGVAWVLNVAIGLTPVDGAHVWVTTDLAGTNLVADGYTNAQGNVTLYLDAGSYYAWWERAPYTPTNPTQITVTAS